MKETCIKCGCTRISGPYYSANYLNPSGYSEGQRLVYRCGQCGYEWTGPTLDEFEPNPPRADAPRET